FFGGSSFAVFRFERRTMRERHPIALRVQPPHAGMPLEIERLSRVRKKRIVNIAGRANEEPIEVRIAIPLKHPRIPVEVQECAGIDRRAIANQLWKMRGK